VIVYFGQFFSFKNYPTSLVKVAIDFDKKMAWTTVWAIFSQTRPLILELREDAVHSFKYKQLQLKRSELDQSFFEFVFSIQ
jgi:hypothetical protein